MDGAIGVQVQWKEGRKEGRKEEKRSKGKARKGKFKKSFVYRTKPVKT